MKTTTQDAARDSFPYSQKLEEARRFLASRGIDDVKPLYGTPGGRRESTTERKVRERWFRRAG